MRTPLPYTGPSPFVTTSAVARLQKCRPAMEARKEDDRRSSVTSPIIRRYTWRVILFLVLALVSVCTLTGQQASPRVVGYYPDWNRGTYPYDAIQYQNITHVAHAFLIPNADGSISGTSGFAHPALVQTAHQEGVRVVVALGGWGQSDGFSPMAADTVARRRFAQTVLDFCLTYNYDGIDLDWEYPANATDSANFTALTRELRELFSTVNRPLSISLAVPSTNWSGRWFNVSGMKDWVDWFGIMTYDYYGSWTAKAGPNSALYGNFSTNTEGWVDFSFAYYTVTRGIPAGQVLIGLPFYGWVFNAPGMYAASTGASQSPYRTIATYPGQGWTRFWDNEGVVPYMVNAAGTQTVSYDDSTSLRLKCEYARAKSTGGVMIWAIGQDYLSGEQPLLQTVGPSMGLATSVRPPPTNGMPSAFRLRHNYPNPFNPTTTIEYSLPHASYATLKVYNVLGEEVSTLIAGDHPAGTFTFTWRVSGMPSGVYIYRLSAGVHLASRKAVLAK